MADDIMPWLREMATGLMRWPRCGEAADEIERLRGRLAMARGNLLGEAELIEQSGWGGPFQQTLCARLREVASLLDQKEQSHD